MSGGARWWREELPDAVGDLGARRLGRLTLAALVALLLLAAAAGAVLHRFGDLGPPPGPAPGAETAAAPAPGGLG